MLRRARYTANLITGKALFKTTAEYDLEHIAAQPTFNPFFTISI